MLDIDQIPLKIAHVSRVVVLWDYFLPKLSQHLVDVEVRGYRCCRGGCFNIIVVIRESHHLKEALFDLLLFMLDEVSVLTRLAEICMEENRLVWLNV